MRDNSSVAFSAARFFWNSGVCPYFPYIKKRYRLSDIRERKKAIQINNLIAFFGGSYRDRTCDPLLVRRNEQMFVFLAVISSHIKNTCYNVNMCFGNSYIYHCLLQFRQLAFVLVLLPLNMPKMNVINLVMIMRTMLIIAPVNWSVAIKITMAITKNNIMRFLL